MVIGAKKLSDIQIAVPKHCILLTNPQKISLSAKIFNVRISACADVSPPMHTANNASTSMVTAQSIFDLSLIIQGPPSSSPGRRILCIRTASITGSLSAVSLFSVNQMTINGSYTTMNGVFFAVFGIEGFSCTHAERVVSIRTKYDIGLSGAQKEFSNRHRIPWQQITMMGDNR